MGVAYRCSDGTEAWGFLSTGSSPEIFSGCDIRAGAGDCQCAGAQCAGGVDGGKVSASWAAGSDAGGIFGGRFGAQVLAIAIGRRHGESRYTIESKYNSEP